MLNQVFLSYRRESEAHVGRVRALAEELRRRGLPVVFDEFYLAVKPEGPDEKWSRWCINQAKDSACVLMVGSSGWYAAFSDPRSAGPDEGRGAAAEANVIQEQLYQLKWVTGRHRVVLLDAGDAEGLPVEISGWRRFAPISNQHDMEDLVRWAAKLTTTSLSVSAAPAGPSWPDKPPVLRWPMADHSGVRDAFATLLTSAAPWRLLPVQGPNDTGKSHITLQMIANALLMPDIGCGRFDFKGTNGIGTEVRALVQDLGVPLPPENSRLNQRLGAVLDALKKRAQPTLLVFDNYEDTGEARQWMEAELLPSLIRASWLRVAIAGQEVPNCATAIWAPVAHAPIKLLPPQPAEWFDYGKQHHPNLTLAEVETVCRYALNKPVLLAQMLGPAS
jgi:hypothetical protein